MLKFFSIFNLIVLGVIFSTFAISNMHIITMNLLSYSIEMPLCVFSFINSFLFFIIGGICGMGYNLVKNFKIFRLNRKIKKLSNKDIL